MGQEWEQSGNKTEQSENKVGTKEYEQNGNKVGTRTSKRGKNGAKVGTKRTPK